LCENVHWGYSVEINIPKTYLNTNFIHHYGCARCGAKLNEKRSLKVAFIELVKKLAGKREKNENRTRAREKERKNGSLIAFSRLKRG